MNLYERIQRAIEFIEDNLEDELDVQKTADRAFMSRAGFYRLFKGFTGHDVKEYVRKRRFSNACASIEKGVPAVDIALACGFSTQESFIKSFKAIVGTTPGNYSKANLKYTFERVNLLETYFEVQNERLREKYPEISVLTNLPKMRVASYHTLSESPEDDAIAVVREWAKRHRLLDPDKGARIFGFDYPAYFARKRGYEFWITVPGNFKFDENDICKEKVFGGGMYALITIEYKKGDIDDFIGKLFGAAATFPKWLRESDYGFAFHQYFEELVPEDEGSDTQRMNMYFPIGRDAETKVPVVTELPELTVAVFHENNQDFLGSEKAWDLYYKWSEMSGDHQRHRVFQAQDSLNKMYAAPAEIWVANPPRGADVSGLEIKTFPGGKYLKFTTLFKSATSELEENCYNIYMNGDHDRADGQLIMEYQGVSEDLNDRMKHWLYYPLKG